MSAEASEKKAGASGGEAAGGGGGGPNKLVLILSVVNVVATLGMVGVLVVSFKQDRTKPSVEDIAAPGEHGAAEGEHGAPAAGGEHGEAAAGGEHGGGGHGGAEAKKKTGDFGKMVSLDQFVVNLSTPGGGAPRFIKVNVSIELPNADVETELTAKMPQVRNTIIDLFNSKRPSDLAGVEGRDYVKEEIKNALNSFMVSGKVKGVFFTNFAFGG